METDHVKLVHAMNREIGSLHATMKHNHELHSANALKIEKITDISNQILIQATKTNGRVTSLEKTQAQLATIISRQDGFIIDGQRKLEKAILDGEETKRIVNELRREREAHDEEVRESFKEAQAERKKIHWTTIEFWVNQKNKAILLLIILIAAWVIMQIFGIELSSIINYLTKII